jgi:hypothetical protein
MTDEWALLRKLAARENISFEAARLPTRKWQTLPSRIRLSYLDWPGRGRAQVKSDSFRLLAVKALALARDPVKTRARSPGRAGFAVRAQWRCKPAVPAGNP